MLARFARFALAGLANSALGWGVIFACLLAGASAVLANALGFAVGLVLSFTLNRCFVFGVSGTIAPAEVLRFLLVFLAAYGLNLGVLLVGERGLGLSPMLAQIPAIAAYAAAFFLLSQRFVFRGAEAQ